MLFIFAAMCASNTADCCICPPKVTETNCLGCQHSLLPCTQPHLPSQQSQLQPCLSTGRPGPASSDVTYIPAHSTATGARGAANVQSPDAMCCASCATCCCAPAPGAALPNGCLGLSCLLYTGSDGISFWLPGPLLNIAKVRLVCCC